VENAVQDFDGYKVQIYDAEFRKNLCVDQQRPLFFCNQVWSKTFTYCKYPGIPELRKYLNELSPVQLRDEAEVSWGITSEHEGEKLIQAIVDSFVQYELSVDFDASLEFANNSTLESLHKDLLGDIKQKVEPQLLVDHLNTEEKWKKVKTWVERFRKRIQGRSKKGLKELVIEQKDKIAQCALIEAEVLGAYLYTGPCFMAYNGIYRQLPQKIMDLLKGDDATNTGNNTLATTLFCISSALVKLSRCTELPKNGGKVYRGLGTMHLPPQFWVPTGKPAWRGGIERAIMSTTTDKDVAVFYSNGKGIVAEISVGRVQMGADMGWISMVRIFC
jgi:hypothetical protein